MLKLSDVLNTLKTNIVSGAKAKAPYRTGALKRSIKGTVKNNRVSISMLNYGRILDKGSVRTQRHKGWFQSVLKSNLAKSKKQLIKALRAKIVANVKGSKTK